MSSASFADNGKWIKEIIYCWSSKKFFPVRERLNVINVSPLTLAETQTRRYKAVILLAKNNYLNLLEWCQIYGQSSRVSWICFRILILMNNNLLAYQFVHNYYYYCNVPLAIIIDRDLPQGGFGMDEWYLRFTTVQLRIPIQLQVLILLSSWY